jgi:capsular exopolysaccharide synthesis family protein
LLDRFVEQPNSGFAEAVRDLRTSIQLSNIDAAPKVIAITSSVSEEGKSILASTLALSNAMAGKKVLLIDSDLRRKVLRRYFLVDAKLGLVSLLSGETTFEETVHHDKRTGLDFLFGDDKKVTPVDFFGSQLFCDLISEMRNRYDLIFLDTPPVLAVSDARVIAQQADVVIYAVRWNSTTRRMIRTGLESLRQANVHAIGLALNKVDPKRMDRYGYYGYGYGAGSGNLQKYYSG